MQLSEHQRLFDDLGIAVVGLTYESPRTHAEFVEKYDADYILLSIEGGTYFRELGIFNEEMREGSRFYGVPHPGIILVDAEGTIVAKFAEEGYVDRPAIELVLDAASELAGGS